MSQEASNRFPAQPPSSSCNGTPGSFKFRRRTLQQISAPLSAPKPSEVGSPSDVYFPGPPAPPPKWLAPPSPASVILPPAPEDIPGLDIPPAFQTPANRGRASIFGGGFAKCLKVSTFFSATFSDKLMTAYGGT
ncbi:hypothetical protein KP509_12G091800 [Ceratopteris richardii]|uniref:Uncharacterized protein n=1 Tax=Ceratopteris richardii TaxID=49495 RepID=A0A8T2TQW7_CERRI|nr:hypothetical protein KP509_12G091800 [Ceratopteris richardii]KAH7424135.1 hypothetical protein KP509_12G091800 [Ceratopteris richardii]KAH7424136.1 hypothetical protein KP509_12G091800 [Ceratopteris richardii]KAH7424137.1 hypothetical protein KP509_12G091800 [Ceratopteris richardii]KAH7424138.1 hypothetical protein KP509_12G091800 [Ceratopteris richardii]